MSYDATSRDSSLTVLLIQKYIPTSQLMNGEKAYLSIYDRTRSWPMRKGNEKLSRNGGVHMILVAYG